MFIVWCQISDVCCLMSRLNVVCLMSEVSGLMSVVWCRRLIFDVCCLMLDVWCHMFDVRRLISDVTCIVSVVYCMMDDVWCQTPDVSCVMFVVWCLIFVVYFRRLILVDWCQTSDVWFLLSDVRRQIIIIIKIIVFITWYCANEHILKDQNANPKTWKTNLFKYFYTAISRLAALIVSGFKYYAIFCLLMFPYIKSITFSEQ